MKKLFFYLAGVCLMFLFTPPAQAQDNSRLKSVQDFDSKDVASPVRHLSFTNIGPTVFSGRVVDLAVNPKDPTHFYVAYASGGLWVTTNNGTSFTPLFDNEAVMTIGAIAVNWEHGIIWVGTGEVNSSRSSYAGVGVYKSLDDGKTWAYTGLPESHHIGKILLHPTRPDMAWVGVLGHLYTTNPERGVYLTKDGGQTWEHSLFINDQTGIVDMVMHPDNANVIYAAAWQRIRKAWDFTEAGPGSAIYRTRDGGKKWKRMTSGDSGFPTGDGVGRIGLTISTQGKKTTLYALLDNYFRQPEDPDASDDLTKADFKTMTAEEFDAIDDKKLEAYLRANRFPRKYTAKSVRESIAKTDVLPADLAYYLEDANSLLFDTPVIGAELYKSTDGGEHWGKTHKDPLDGVYFSYGYYFGVITADPSDADRVYIAGVPVLASSDGGQTFKSINGDNVHVDHHKIWVNPERSSHLIIGNDGGINISYDTGETWIKCNSPAVGQFYYINTDEATPYNVYGGTQDNGVWKGSHTYEQSTRWHSTGKYPYDGLLGGDGMQVQIDTRDNTTIYTGFQFGNYFRINTETGERARITPVHELGERPYRWNWQSPIHVSKHNQDIIYFGAHQVFRSFDQGDHFSPISQDLTKGGRPGDVPFGTLSTIHESPLRFGLLYSGSDDGKLFKTPDGGVVWTDIGGGLPDDLWVARVQASAHDEGRVYVALNGYRNDDFKAYVYVSDDYGATWKNISGDLPDEPVNVIKEDPKVKDLIYVGTDRGTYASIDGGLTYTRFTDGLTTAPVHDLVVQDEAEDLLIGTHGRSIYRGSIKFLRQMASMTDPALALFEIPKIRYRSNVGNRRAFYSDFAKNTIELNFYSPEAVSGTIGIHQDDVGPLFEREVSVPLGLSSIEYDGSVRPDAIEAYRTALGEKAEDFKEADDGQYYLMPGKYTVKLTVGEDTLMQTLEITER